jgi:hypothetical protein
MKRSSSQWRARAQEGLVTVTLAALATAGLAGCYNPKISPNLKCNNDYEPNAGQCPEGYHCSTDGHCLKGPYVDAGVDRGVDKPVPHPDGPVEVPMEAPPAETAPDVPPVCAMPVAGCAADTTKKCDPLCQSGCPGCHDKCSVNKNGDLTCNPPLDSRPRGPFEACDPSAEGSAAQTDNCAPGLVCLTDGCGNRCYTFCKVDADCPGSFCSRDVGSGVKVCDVPTKACNPIKNNGLPDGCGTDTDTLGCYLSPTVTDRTFCDCPFKGQSANSSCTVSRDCFAGLVCAGAGPLCRPACSLAPGSTDCPGGTCVKLNGSTKFGYCN